MKMFAMAVSLLIFSLPTLAQISQGNSNIAPNHSTSCGFAKGQPEREGVIMVSGSATLFCGARSDAEVDAKLMSHCQGCAVVAHFTHACGAYSQTADNNKSNTAWGYAVVRFAEGENSLPALIEAKRQADEKCSSNGGIRCYTRLSDCDTGTYMAPPSSGRSAR
jgi:hypothetical protein